MAAPNTTSSSPPIQGEIAPKPNKGKVWGRPFKKGQSGNAGGKPKQRENLAEIARSASPKAMKTLVEIMENEKASFAVRAYCAEKVLDRAFGRPQQQTNLNIGTNMRSLRELSDQELMSIIEGNRAPTALSPPVIDQTRVEVEPSVEPDPLAEP